MVDGLSIKHIYDELFSLLQEVNTNLDIEKFDFDDVKDIIKNESRSIQTSLDLIDNNLEIFKTKLTDFFDQIEDQYFTISEEIYKTHVTDDPSYILDQYKFKQLIYDQETRNFFIGRIKNYTDWKWPAVEIRPALGEFTDTLLGCDPLYLVDTHLDFFKEVKTKWTPEFQRRVRYYTIDESAKMPLGSLPQNQIGLVSSVNFFNFRSLASLDRYIKSMFNLLRPGGVAIFTYNNCDYPIGVDNFEHKYYCYTPGRKVKEICRSHGFKVLSAFDMDNNVSWVEIQKPGKLTSLRGGQSLAKIETLHSKI